MIGVLIVGFLGIGGYILYKRSKPSREMFDEMVSKCQDPCDTFSNLTEMQLNQLFKGFQTLSKEDAQFMVDSFPKSSDEKRFMSLFLKMKNVAFKK